MEQPVVSERASVAAIFMALVKVLGPVLGFLVLAFQTFLLYQQNEQAALQTDISRRQIEWTEKQFELEKSRSQMMDLLYWEQEGTLVALRNPSRAGIEIVDVNITSKQIDIPEDKASDLSESQCIIMPLNKKLLGPGEKTDLVKCGRLGLGKDTRIVIRYRFPGDKTVLQQNLVNF